MAALRKRSSFWGDMRIMLLGTWGFLRQCLKAWVSPAKAHDELESGQ